MPSPAKTKAKNASWLVFERAVGVAIGFFVMTIVARHLGPAGFGAYTYLFGLVALFAPLAGFGLSEITMRHVAADPDNAHAMLGAALVIQAGGALVGAGLAILSVAAFGGPAGVTTLLIAVASLRLLAQPGEVFNAWFTARERMGWVVVPRILAALAIAAATLMLVLREAGLDAFVSMRSAEAALLAVAALLAYAVATGAVPVPRFDRARLASLVREGWPLMLSGFAVIIYMRIDQVMLGHLSTETELGLYGVAVRVADAALVVPVALRASFFASILRAHKAGPEAFERQSQRLYDVMFVAGVGTMLAVGLASYLLFEPVFGADYAMGLPMVLVLLLALPWVALGSGRGPILIAQGWLWTTTATTALAAGANVVLNLLLIPRYGGIGAAAATVVYYWLASHGSSLMFKHLRPTGRAMTRSLNIFAAAARILRAFKAEAQE